MTTRILIAGGGYAGLFAAARLRRYSGMKVTLIDAKDQFTQRVRLHEYLVGRPSERLPYRELLQGSGIDFIQGRIVTLQPDDSRLVLENDEGARVLSYDWLLYALGSRSRRSLDIPGLSKHALTLEAGPQLEQARQRLQALPADRSVVVLGAGLTGLEAATEIQEAFPQLKVKLVNGGTAFQDYAAGAEQEIRRVLQTMGIQLFEGHRVVSVSEGAVHCANSSVIASDLTLHCLGLEVPELARDAGVRTAADGRIQVDAYLRSLSHPNILALGDAAELDSGSCLAQRMACAAACPMGTYAADLLHRLQSGKKLLTFRFGFTGRCVSLGRRAGVIQLVNARDQARRWYLRGQLAVWIKEWICRGTVQVPLWELRSGLALYRWYQPKELA